MKHVGCFGFFHVVLEELWIFLLGTKQPVRVLSVTLSVQFHSFGSRIYLVTLMSVENLD